MFLRIVQMLCSSCQLFVLFQGLVHIGKEISKLEEKQAKTNSQLSKVMEAMKIEDYENKVFVCHPIATILLVALGSKNAF